MNYFLNHDFEDLLIKGRKTAQEALKDSIQEKVNDMGVEILFVGVANLRPPAESPENVIERGSGPGEENHGFSPVPVAAAFEKPIAELEGKIEELRHLSGSEEINIADEVGKLQSKANKLLTQTYSNLSPWQKTQVARHHNRPHALDYIQSWIDGFTPLAGDRSYAEDRGIIFCMGRFRGRSIIIIGT